jgi:prolyl-tRNA synthetase
MDQAGAQELIAPVLHPKSLWKETNRTNSVGFELMSIKDRNEMEFVLGGTAEEMLVDLVRKFQISYKDLPFNFKCQPFVDYRMSTTTLQNFKVNQNSCNKNNL